jgi:tRNA pseudouridine55 synthase
MATGLLVLGVGTATRLLTFLVGADKTYTATIRLGSSTVTDDAQGEVVSLADSGVLANISDADIREQVIKLTGTIDQRPSAVSAIKVDGKRAYDRVRAGDDVVLDARTVTVSRFDVHSIRRTPTAIDVDVAVVCSSGTYIRALARDIGVALGCGGHLTALRRTRVGPFSVDDACLPDAIGEARLIAPAHVAGELFPTWSMNDVETTDIGHGKKVEVAMPDAPLVAAVHEGRLVAVVAVTNGVARVVTGFPYE